MDQFVEHLLPSLLSLSSDPVPNVRVLLAKTLRQTLLEKGTCTVFLNLDVFTFIGQQLDFHLGDCSKLCDSMLQVYYISRYILCIVYGIYKMRK